MQRLPRALAVLSDPCCRNVRVYVCAVWPVHDFENLTYTGIFSRSITRSLYAHHRHADSCCALDLAVTEFDSQGLELDCTLVGWGNDFIIQNGKWNNDRAKRYAYTSEIKDAFTLRRNAYRVLLTRARDGMILYVPSDELWNETREHLIKCGIEDLSMVDRDQ